MAELGVPILTVDYADVKVLTEVLEDNKVDTVISAMDMTSHDRSTPGEFGLIEAAEASKTTRRMISSDWGTPNTAEYVCSACWLWFNN